MRRQGYALSSRAAVSGLAEVRTAVGLPVRGDFRCVEIHVRCVKIHFRCVKIYFRCMEVHFRRVEIHFRCVEIHFRCVAVRFRCARLFRRACKDAEPRGHNGATTVRPRS